MAEKTETLSLIRLQYDLLSSSENAVKFRGLNTILLHFRNVLEKQSNINRLELEKELCSDVVHPLIVSIQTSSESCREVAIEILHLFVTNSIFITNVDVHLIPLVDKCVYRGLKYESSEEIRCQLMTLLRSYLTRRQLVDIESHLGALRHILEHSLEDPYPEVKKETCGCLLDMNTDILKRLMQVDWESLVEPLMAILSHQHYRVRIAGISSIGTMAMYANVEFIEKIYPKLAQTLIDQVPQVRLCITRVLGSWLVQLPNRHYMWHRLIALFLTSLTDEVPEVCCLARELWCNAGKQYEKEIDTDLEKEMMGLNLSPCPHIKPELQLFPIGCKAIVCNNYAKLLPAIHNDLRDWMDSVKLKAAQLLYHLIANAKEGVAPHILEIIDMLNEGCKITDLDILNMVTASAQLTGYFVNSNIWCPVILKLIEENSSVSCLRVLEKLLNGCPHIDEFSESNIIDSLTDSNICQNESVDVKKITLSCAEILLDFAVPSKEKAFKYFHVLATIHGTTETLRERVNFIMTKLWVWLGVDSNRCVWNALGKKLIEEIELLTPCDLWTANSVEWKIFICLLREADLTLLNKETERIIKVVSMPEKDYTMKFSCIMTLGNFYENLDDVTSVPESYYNFCIQDVIFPNLVWRAGKSAACVRAAAATSLYLLVKKYYSKTLDKKLLDDIISHLMNSLEDDNATTRHFVCRTLDILLHKFPLQIDSENFLSVIPMLINRMDDVVQNIRIVSCKTVGKCFVRWFNSGQFETNGGHGICFVNAIKKLLLYLYDVDDLLKAAVSEVLKDLAIYNMDLIKQNLDEMQHKNSNPVIENLIMSLNHLNH